LIGFVGVFMPVQEIFCSALAAVVSLKNIIFLIGDYLIFPHRQQAGQAVMPRHLSLIKCLFLNLQTGFCWQHNATKYLHM
jgi:hypothetical protein